MATRDSCLYQGKIGDLINGDYKRMAWRMCSRRQLCCSPEQRLKIKNLSQCHIAARFSAVVESNICTVILISLSIHVQHDLIYLPESILNSA